MIESYGDSIFLILGSVKSPERVRVLIEQLTEAVEPKVHCRACKQLIPERKAYWHRGSCVGFSFRPDPKLQVSIHRRIESEAANA